MFTTIGSRVEIATLIAVSTAISRNTSISPGSSCRPSNSRAGWTQPNWYPPPTSTHVNQSLAAAARLLGVVTDLVQHQGEQHRTHHRGHQPDRLQDAHVLAHDELPAVDRLGEQRHRRLALDLVGDAGAGRPNRHQQSADQDRGQPAILEHLHVVAEAEERQERVQHQDHHRDRHRQQEHRLPDRLLCGRRRERARPRVEAERQQRDRPRRQRGQHQRPAQRRVPPRVNASDAWASGGTMRNGAADGGTGIAGGRWERTRGGSGRGFSPATPVRHPPLGGTLGPDATRPRTRRKIAGAASQGDCKVVLRRFGGRSAGSPRRAGNVSACV